MGLSAWRACLGQTLLLGAPRTSWGLASPPSYLADARRQLTLLGRFAKESQGGAPHVPHAPTQAFVQLFEWSWPDVAAECESWLGPKGFAAVQVSPPTEHIQGPQWWTRYQPVTYNLTSRSGGEKSFVSMLRRCRAAGVDVYVDAVFNHCAGGSGLGVGGSRYGNRSFPLFGPSDFYHDERRISCSRIAS